MDRFEIPWEWLGERERLQEKARQTGYPFVDLDRVVKDKFAKDLLPLETMRRLRLRPLIVKADTLYVAMADPFDISAITEVEAATGYRVNPVFVVPSELDKSLNVC